MFKSIFFPTVLLFSFISFGNELDSPSDFLGYPLGTYFSRHHQVVDYFEHLEESSNGQMILKEYGKTNENRTLLLSFISSAENIQNIEEIRKAHEDGSAEKVAIVWLSYNVHGNEASCTEAAMKAAYTLLTEKQEWLKDVLVIIDPCINPDGRDRYVNWYNQKKNISPDVDFISAEHQEPWPAGRVNHYLFDLNRDWSWLTQVETRERIKVYNQWLPHVHADFHEQFYDDPYYFAPAAPPFHTVISDWQKEFQTGLGRHHASYFDKEGWLYFTRQFFDLLYPGYGDTYPTYNGAIGMTYEQGGHGVAGLAVQTADEDTLTLVDRIEHHFTTSISTVEFSVNNKLKLIEEFKKYPTNQEYEYNTYVIWGDDNKLLLLKDLIQAHGIKYGTGSGQKISGYEYETGKQGQTTVTKNHIIISTQQKKGPLATVLFEPKTTLEDSVTYDLTSWALPYAYGLNCIASEQKIDISDPQAFSPELSFAGDDTDAIAFLIPWKSMSSARVLSALIEDKIRVRFAEKPFSFGEDKFESGTLIVLKSENANKEIGTSVLGACKENNVSCFTTNTGMVDTGNDFGSPDVKLIDPPKVALITNQGFAPAIGEFWYYFEQELNYPITLLNVDDVRPDVLEDIDVLIATTGGLGLADSLMAEWVSNGGKLIAVSSALNNFGPDSKFKIRNKVFDNEEDVEEEKDAYENAHIHYCSRDRYAIGGSIQGAVYKCVVDNTNPLAFGYGKSYFSLKNSPSAYHWLKNGENPVYLDAESVPESGFVGNRVKDDQAKSMVFSVEKKGEGCAIFMVDSPIFRGFWENGKLLVANAIFFVNR
ncbi:MAG: M14 family metallopeptidase [Crocinitomicaceae bacterium]|nr:M14 family metallopeptidase [Crocinitomicaceae bacterium]